MILRYFRYAYIFSFVFITQWFQPNAPAQSPEDFLGEEIYNDTLKKVEEAVARNALAREISHLYVKGAGECRDEGSDTYAIALFEAAILEDPSNAHAHSVYGDYLMGYRGLYEQAGTKYYRALEIIEQYPEAFDDTFKASLERSIQIWHRDGKDGMPLMTNYSTDDYSLYFEALIDYSKSSIDEEEYHTSLIRQLFAEQFTGQDRIRDIPKKLPRRNDLIKFGGNLLLRFGDQRLPYLKLSYEKVDVDINNTNPESFQGTGSFTEWDGDFDAIELTIGKNFYLSPNLDLNLEGIYSRREIETTDPFNNNIRIANEKGDNYLLFSGFTYYFGTNTLKLRLGGNFANIDRTEGSAANNEDFEDSFNSQLASLRLSLFGLATDKDNPSRFRGRRSTHYEIGFSRNERHFETAITEIDYRPFVQMEYFGMLNGHVDLIFNYNAWIKDFNKGFLRGLYEAHQFKFTPSWVIVYNLYEDTFKRGIEFLSVGMPLRYTIGEKAGTYSRFNIGLELNTELVLFHGIRVIPTIESDYAWYPELDRSDWGLFAKCVFRY